MGVDRGKLLEDVLKSSWPSQRDLIEQDVVRPFITDEIHRRLAKYRFCVLIGTPKSGKTTLAKLVGFEILQGGKAITRERLTTRFSKVRYLDLTDIKDVKEDINELLPLNRQWLFIVDNWHALPECHDRLLELIEKDWKGVGCLVVLTRFSTTERAFPDETMPDEIADMLLPLEKHISSKENPPIYTSSFLLEVAKGMIESHVQKYLGIRPMKEGLDLLRIAGSKNLHFDQRDYEQAFAAPQRYKKVRGSLRYLSWRLKAWNPAECHLRDVRFDKVLAEVRQDIVYPFNSYLGTLEKIAALAQWELPYPRGFGTDLPQGIEALERKNVVVPIQPGTAWQMDSTDAFLLMYERTGDEWLSKTVEYLRRYMESSPDESSRVIRNVLVQALPGTKPALLLSLLWDNQQAIDAIIVYWKKLAGTERLSFLYVVRLIDALLRPLPKDEQEANKRLGIAAALLTPEMGSLLGKSALSLSRFPFTSAVLLMTWFLSLLRKGGIRFSEFVASFIREYGEDSFVTLLDVITSGKRQRLLLKLLGYYDSSLRTRLRSQVTLHPRHLGKFPFTSQLYWLAHGSIETGWMRDEKIDALMGIDEDNLVNELRRNPRAAGRMQFLLQSALWLSKDEGRRIAGLIPRIWPKLDLLEENTKTRIPEDHARKLAFLVLNCWFNNCDAAQDLVSLFIKTPLHILVPSEKALGVVGLLAAIEKVQPGAVRSWCSTEVDYLSRLVLSPKSEISDDLLVSLAAFAPDIMTQLMQACSVEARQRFVSHLPGPSGWIKYGALSLCEEEWQASAPSSIPVAEEIALYKPLQAILALYGVQLSLGVEAVQKLLFSLANLPGTSPWIPLLLAQNQPPWEPGSINNMVRTVLQAGFDPRTTALHNVILVGVTLSPIEWDMGYRFDIYHDGHRALETAIHEKMLRVSVDHTTGIVRSSLNGQHQIVQTVCKQLQDILAPVRASSLVMEEWDTALRETGTRSEQDYFRSKIIRAGLVSWIINSRGGRLEPRFSFVDKPDRNLLYGLIHLIPEATPPLQGTPGEVKPLSDSGQPLLDV